MTLAQTFVWISTCTTAYVMVRLGTAKNALRMKTVNRCPSCGRRPVWGRCLCTNRSTRR